MMDVEKFLAAAKKGVVTVVFKKLGGGEIRHMVCTLNPETSGAKVKTLIEQRPDNDHIVVWALDRDAWRSFRVNTVIDWFEGSNGAEKNA